MAGAGYKLFTTGSVLTAADVNTYLAEQTVMVFANAAARTTALSGVVSEGMISYLKDTNAVEVYDGSNWVSSDDPNAIQNSIINAKGDLIVGSANDTPSILSVSSDGSTLVADSSATTGLRWQGNYAAAKNVILNSDFRIWQRGTSFSGANQYSADRWFIDGDRTGMAVSQQTFTPGTAPVAGYEGQYFARFTAGTGGTFSNYQQRVEDVRTFAGQTVTVSYWAKCSTGTLTNEPYLIQQFGSGGSGAVSIPFTTNPTNTITTSWQRFTHTVTVPSVSGKTIGTSSFVQVLPIRLTSATTTTVDVWGVQWEAGSVATSFQTATGTLAGELCAAQRYYYRSTGQTFTVHALGFAESTTNAQFMFTTPVTMRKLDPTPSWSNAEIALYGTGTYAITGLALTGNTGSGTQFLLTASGATGLTQNRPYALRNANSTTAYVALDAEL